MDWVTVAIVVAILASMALLWWLSRKRHWNVEHEDDERRGGL